MYSNSETKAGIGLNVDNNANFKIGDSTPEPNFNGLIDEVRIYNRALNADEIKANYEAGQIIITSSPSGAEIFVDGQSKGLASPSLSVYGMAPGSHNVKCRLSGSSDDEKTVTVATSSVTTITCSPSQLPLLSVSPAPSFNLGTMNAGESVSQIFSISNAGGGTLAWSVSDDQPWITINPTSGTNSGTVTININTAGLSPSIYSGTIIVTSNGGSKSGSISLNIQPTIQPTTSTPIATTPIATTPIATTPIAPPPKTPTKTPVITTPLVAPPVTLASIMGVILILTGLLFTALTTIKKDVIFEFGITERTLKYVGGTGVLLVMIGAYILIKCLG